MVDSESRKKFKAVLFDLDGTLLDTLQDLALSGNRMLEALNLPVHPLEAYRYFVGAGALNLVKAVLPSDRRDQDTIEKGLNRFLEVYNENWARNTRPYDGISEMLDYLQDREYRLVVLSNKPDDFTKKCIGQFLSGWRFEHVWGKRDDFKPKPFPESALKIAELMKLEPADFFYLGDTGIDMETATRAGMHPTGVLWGFRPAEELLEAGARVLLQKPMEIADYL